MDTTRDDTKEQRVTDRERDRERDVKRDRQRARESDQWVMEANSRVELSVSGQESAMMLHGLRCMGSEWAQVTTHPLSLFVFLIHFLIVGLFACLFVCLLVCLFVRVFFYLLVLSFVI